MFGISTLKSPVSEYWAPLAEGFYGLGFSSIERLHVMSRMTFLLPRGKKVL